MPATIIRLRPALFYRRILREDYQICLTGNFNSDYLSLVPWMSPLDLTDAIANKHGSCPVTYNRREFPLDVVFLSSHLCSHTNVFLSFGTLQGNHRGIWVDVPTFLILGHNPPQPTHPDTRRLKLRDPQVVAQYLDYLMFHCTNEGLFHRMNYIHENFSTPMTPEMIYEFENINSRLNILMTEAEA